MTAIIGWIGSVLSVSSMLQKRQMRFRVLNLAACAAMVTFNVANASWSIVTLNVVVAAINIQHIIVLLRRQGATTTATDTTDTTDTTAPTTATIATNAATARRQDRCGRNRPAAGAAPRSTRSLIAARPATAATTRHRGNAA